MEKKRNGVGRKGKVAQVLGAVIDVEFSEEQGIPNIYDALLTTNKNIDDNENNLVLEVQQHLGDNMVRVCCDGLLRRFSARTRGH